MGDKSFFPRNADGYDSKTVVEAFLAQHYLNRGVPHLVIIGEKIHKELLQTLLTEQSGHKVVINLRPVGERRVWLEMANNNAQLALKQMLNRQANQEERLQALQQALNLPGISRVECFDMTTHRGSHGRVLCCL